MIQTAYWLKDDTDHKTKKDDFFLKEFLKDFFMTSPMPSSKIFYDIPFWSYKRLNQRGEKESSKNWSWNNNFLQLFFHLFDSHGYIIKTENCRRFSKTALNSSWKHLSKTFFFKLLLFFMFSIIFQSICSLYHVPPTQYTLQTLITSKQKIVEDFRRKHWIGHEKIFQKLLKKQTLFFNSFSSFSQYAYHFFFCYI
jgi:hypothetical protein